MSERLKGWVLGAVGWTLLMCSTNTARGSGIYLPPRAPVLRQVPIEQGSPQSNEPASQRSAVSAPDIPVSRIEVMQGKVYFNAKLFSSAGKFCVECHGLRENFPFDRQSLQSKADRLGDLVHACLVDPRRSGATTIAMDSREVRALKAYLISSYRLNP